MVEVDFGNVVGSGFQPHDSSNYINGNYVNCMLRNTEYQGNLCGIEL